MSEITYLAIAFSSRTANGQLRAAVTAAAPPDAKIVRTIGRGHGGVRGG
jgi:hypothetical protein